METGVIVARFQTPYLHEGHKSLINEVKTVHEKIVIILGISPLNGTLRNPFDFHIRERMIKKQYPECVVLPLNDHPSDDFWSKGLDQLLKNTFPTEKFILYGSRDSFIAQYSGGFPTMEIPKNGEHNSTIIREQHAQRVIDNEDFRKGILYAFQHQYEKIYPTVDIAVFRNDKSELLIGRKHEVKQWRIPGGFVDPTDISYESAALRELTEEAGKMEVSEMKYERSLRINDWRYVHENDKIISTLYSCDHLFGSAQASDDLVEVKWYPINQLDKMIQQNLSLIHI